VPISAMAPSQPAEWVNSHVSQFTAMNCMKKVSQVKAEPIVKSRKFRSARRLLSELTIAVIHRARSVAELRSET
jgi:hypothetical protein